jgi:hypothetical protein
MNAFHFILIAFIIFFADGSIASAQCIPPPSGMVAWWPMDDTTGAARLIDIIGGNYATPSESPVGAVQAPRSVKGKVGGAIEFKKFGNTGLCGARVSPDGALYKIGTADFTIDAWIKFPASKAVDRSHYIVNRYDRTTTRGYGLSIVSRSVINNQRMEFTWGDGSNSATVQTTRAIAPNRWHHVAVTFARNAGGKALDIRLYVDGSQLGQQVRKAQRVGRLANSLFLEIGTQPSSLDQPITLDELEIFNRALDSSEVRSIWAADRFGKCKTLPGGLK